MILVHVAQGKNIRNVMGSSMGSYVSPKLEVRESIISGKGLVAIKEIKKEELVIDYTHNPQRAVSIKEGRLFDKGILDYSMQIDEDILLIPTKVVDTDRINHSCDPNCGIRGIFQIVAMRGIKPGEEVTYDYAMADSDDYEMNCNCKSSICRKTIRGDDWKDQELQTRYNGFFIEYLQKKISIQGVQK